MAGAFPFLGLSFLILILIIISLLIGMQEGNEIWIKIKIRIRIKRGKKIEMHPATGAVGASPNPGAGGWRAANHL